MHHYKLYYEDGHSCTTDADGFAESFTKAPAERPYRAERIWTERDEVMLSFERLNEVATAIHEAEIELDDRRQDLASG